MLKAAAGEAVQHPKTDHNREDLFLMYREKEDTIERDISLCGYYAIITSQHMSARGASSV
jgi:hypothetical protein